MWGSGGGGNPIFFLHISFSWAEISFHVEFHLPGLPRSGRFMVGDKTKKTTRQQQQQQDVFTEIRGPLASTKEHQQVQKSTHTSQSVET